MSRKGKVSGSEKIAAIEKYLRREDSLKHLAALLGVCLSSTKQWLRIYQSLGPNALLESSKNTVYSAELKNKAVKNFLAGVGSRGELCKKYGLKSKAQLHSWILKYNSQRLL